MYTYIKNKRSRGALASELERSHHSSGAQIPWNCASPTKMRSLISVGIVALCVAIRTNAVPNRPDIQPSSDEEFQPGHLRISEDVNNTATAEEALDLVMERFEKFSTEYLRIWRNISDTYVVSSLLEFIDLATFSYGREKTMKNAVMANLGFADDDPEIVALGLQRLVNITNIYVPIGSLSAKQAKGNRREIFARVSKLRQSFARRSSRAGRRKSCLKSVSWKVDYIAQPASSRSVHSNANESAGTETVYKRRPLRYGNLSSHDATVVELPGWTDNDGNGLSVFFLRPNSERGYELLTNRTEKIDLDDLRAFPVERVHFDPPTFEVESNFTVNRWAPQLFGSENPFEADAANPLKISSSKFGFRHFSRYFNFNVNKAVEATSRKPGTSRKARRSSGLQPAINFRLDRPFIAIVAATGKLNIELFTVAFGGR